MFFAGSVIYLLQRAFGPSYAISASVLVFAVSVAFMIGFPEVRVPHTLFLILIFGPVLTLIGAGDLLLGARSRLIDRLTVFGDMSYSIYLWHFPLILVVTNITVAFGIDRAWLSGNVPAFLGFIALVLVCSYASMRYIEFPARRYIQQRFLSR